MKRKAFLISNAGEKEAENYCSGVFKDINNFKKFLVSPLGGSWKEDEIEYFDRPSIYELRRKIGFLPPYKYTMIIFSGHGYINEKGSTMLELNNDDYIHSEELKKGARKRTIILDCCRVCLPEPIYETTITAQLAKPYPQLDAKACRRYYDDAINKSKEGTVIMYGCDIDETSGDSSRNGGYYTSSLFAANKDWVEINRGKNSNTYKLNTVVAVHDHAIPHVQALSSNKQNPQIDKPRSGPYFPFSVMG